MHPETHESVPRFKIVNLTGPFICDKCEAKLRSRTSFINHFRWRHSTKPHFSCDLCSKTFNRKDHLAEHMRSQHFKVNPFTCKVCGHKSNAKYGLKIHMQQHEPKTECKVCHKMVANMHDHMRIHVEVKCLICQKIYSKMSLSRHIKNVHQTIRKNCHKINLL